MKNNRHRKLKGRMIACSVTEADIAQRCNVSNVYVSHRFTGRHPWTWDMILEICGMCGIEETEIPLFFERCGKK